MFVVIIFLFYSSLCYVRRYLRVLFEINQCHVAKGTQINFIHTRIFSFFYGFGLCALKTL